MKTQLLLICFLGAMTAMVVYGEIQVCGRDLAQLLGTLCENAPTMMAVKRFQQNGVQEFDHTWPWMRSYHAKALTGSREKRPVATECCIKPCSMDELLSYC